MLSKSLQAKSHPFFLESWKGIREEEQSSCSAGHWKCVGHLRKKAAVSKKQAGCQVGYSFWWVMDACWPLNRLYLSCDLRFLWAEYEKTTFLRTSLQLVEDYPLFRSNPLSKRNYLGSRIKLPIIPWTPPARWWRKASRERYPKQRNTLPLKK